MEDKSQCLVRIVQEANVLARPLKITGGNTKSFLGCQSHGERVDISEHVGILNYEPSELVLTARAGTLITEVEERLRESGQFLPFEPPNFQSDATVGGTVASALSGPSRPYLGSVRDFVLGVTCINGRGELLKFGGQVIKNVAGYDVSRLMVGAMGTLGIILDVSFKVLPLPEAEQTRLYEFSEEVAISKMNEWAAKPFPISAACYLNKQLRIRLSGTGDGVEASARELGGVEDGDGRKFWQELREQQLSFFEMEEILWRLVVPPSTPPLGLPGGVLIDWGGAQRWLLSSQNDHDIRSLIESAGGHASRFRGGDRNIDVFHPLSPEVAMLHRNLKKAFDPMGILNPGRLYMGI